MSRWIAVAVVTATLSAALGIGARATYGAQTSGDEPYYLLTAQSLADGGGLDIADELAAGSYRPYHEIPVDPQTTPLEDGRHVSPHDPLLPVLLAPAMALPDAAAWPTAKLLLALMAGALAGLTAWVATVRFGVRPATAGVVVAGLHAAMPLAPYGTQVYPEVPAALAVVTAVALAASPRPRIVHVLGLAIAVTALPWLSVKFVPVAAVVAVVGGAALWRAAGPGSRVRRAILLGAGALAASGVLYLLAHQLLYGGWTVYAAGDHFVESGELGVVGAAPDHLGRTRRLVGLLVDAEFGVAAWTPAWLAVPAATAWVVARRIPGRWLLLAPAAAGWATATWVALTMHGWWSPGRQVVSVLPLLAVAIAVLADAVVVPAGRRWRAVGGAVLWAGVASWAWLAVEATTGRRALIVDFASTTGPVHRALAAAMPAGRTGGLGADLGLLAWTVLLAASAWAAARAARTAALRATAASGSPVRPCGRATPAEVGA